MVAAGGVRLRLLLGITVTVAVLGRIVFRVIGGVATPGWPAIVLVVAMAIGVFTAGLPVRRLRDHRPGRPVSALYAARALVLAQAAALTGAGLLGWYAAQALQLVPDLDIDSQRARLWLVGGHAIAAVLLVVSGLLTQANCRINPEDRIQPKDWTDATDATDPVD